MTDNSRTAGLLAEMRELAGEFAPCRFAIFWIDREAADGGILYWGLRLPDGTAVVCDESGRSLGRFSSPESARRLFARRAEVALTWLDAPS